MGMNRIGPVGSELSMMNHVLNLLLDIICEAEIVVEYDVEWLIWSF